MHANYTNNANILNENLELKISIIRNIRINSYIRIILNHETFI